MNTLCSGEDLVRSASPSPTGDRRCGLPPLSLWRTLRTIPTSPPRGPRTTLSIIPKMNGEAGKLLCEVARSRRVSTADLLGWSRKRLLAHARQELMWSLFATGRYSYPAIGRFLGGRDHTTILHGVKAHWRRQAEMAAAE